MDRLRKLVAERVKQRIENNQPLPEQQSGSVATMRQTLVSLGLNPERDGALIDALEAEHLAVEATQIAQEAVVQQTMQVAVEVAPTVGTAVTQAVSAIPGVDAARALASQILQQSGLGNVVAQMAGTVEEAARGNLGQITPGASGGNAGQTKGKSTKAS